jgi:hypothetical protein
MADNRKATLEEFRKVYVEFLRSELAERDARLVWEAAAADLKARKSKVDKAQNALVQDAIGFALMDFVGATDLVKETQRLRAEGYVPAEEPSADSLYSWNQRASGD